jgi:methylmalonyl-CoA mutase N-terminal domain/subunit
LRDEAHLPMSSIRSAVPTVEALPIVEEESERVIAQIDAAGGMYAAVDSGLVQTLIGESALAFQRQIESGAQKVVGVNAFQVEEDASARASLERPDPADIDKQIARYQRFKAARSQDGVQRALDALARAANEETLNTYEKVVDAALAGVTHGEICTCLRREMGFGQPLCIV